ncbi:nickel/cobalt transporter [Desulfonema magnum]|uniref:Nickel/cobalt efflux system n=1 Tax=Desulfonema magnum TaxID=45655 RepID=A0A975BL79_9BACT|nr:hypothetical protein [Desulfonema magnum]QTA87168.1 High-affinity nickel-transport protein [Desulfonema magnum]
MSKIILLTLILLSLPNGAAPVNAQNPFTSKGKSPQVSPAPSLPNPFLARIVFWQHQLNQEMSSLAREAKKTGNLRPLLFLIIIAFAYGVLHATGPGHGKAVAMSYMASGNRKLGSGLLFGNLVAFFHGLSAICLVLILHFIIQKGVTGSFESISHKTQIISYSLIALLGAGLLIRSLMSWYRRNNDQDQDSCSEESRKGPVVMALILGMVPCPGVVLVMLFSLSLNMPGLGVLLALSLTLGMAVTISAVVVAALASKNFVLGSLERRQRLTHTIELITETTTALLVTSLGLIFLAATLA